MAYMIYPLYIKCKRILYFMKDLSKLFIKINYSLLKNYNMTIIKFQFLLDFNDCHKFIMFTNCSQNFIYINNNILIRISFNFNIFMGIYFKCY